ncbi:AAA family ATPase, partial [Acinetobacter sp. ACNIH4]
TLNYAVPSSSEISFNLAPNTTFNIHPDQFRVTPIINNIIVDIASDLKSKLEKISYIGPLRKRIEKTYIIENDFETSVGCEGDKIGYFLYAHGDTILQHINKYFLQYGIPYEILIKKLGDDTTGPIISILLKDLRTDTIVAPSDVGVGISQLLPIIVEGIIRENSSICIEQPEIHLHPKLQADLAEFFVDTCKNNQWIIETHSEALMLRLQKLLRLKDKRLKYNDISIIYVHPTNNGSRLYQIRLDEDGKFRDEWPVGFFDERIDEIFG